MPKTFKKLLVVDDEPATLILLSQIFGQMGYRVSTASDGFAALESIRESTPDILLSDLNMPGMSGFELLSVVRRRLPSIYVIATSGAYTGEVVPKGIAADAFYEKATGLRFLLELMELANDQSVPGVRALDAAEPMWLQDLGDGTEHETRVMMHCPECMRSFPHTDKDSRVQGNEFRETGCVYCGSAIHYAVVLPLDPLTSQPYHPVLVAALVPHLVPEVLKVVEDELVHGIALVGKWRA